MKSIRIWTAEYSESICEVNLGSLQKGDEEYVFSAVEGFTEGFAAAHVLLDLLYGNISPGTAVIIVKE